MQTSGYTPAGDIKVYYELHGGAPTGGAEPILLVPGGMMAIETAYAGDLLPRLARLRPVIAVEAQGHGHTADRPGPASLQRMSEDLKAVLDHLGVRRAHLVGHSLGGMMAIGLAMAHPDRAASLNPIGATISLEGMLPELVRLQRGQIAEPSAALAPLLPTEADFAAWRAHYDRSAPDPAAFETVLGKLNALLSGWNGWSEAEVRAISAPTLVIIGDHDFVRVEHAAEMARLIPNARLAVLPGTTHMDIIHRADWLAEMIGERIARV